MNTSATIGTVPLTGLVITPTNAFGQLAAMPSANTLIMPAFTLNKSARSIPGLRGIPAGIKTISAPVNAPLRSSRPKPATLTSVGMCDKSTATPGTTGATSYKDNSEPAGS